MFLRSLPNVPICSKIPMSATRFPSPPFWSESDLEKLPVPLNKKLGLDRFQSPDIRCPAKKIESVIQLPFTSCLEETPVQFDKKSAQLVKSLKSRTYFLFISSNFCEIQRKSAAGRLLARFNSIQLGFLTRFQTPLLWSCSRRLTITGSLSDPNDGTVSQRNQHFHFLR